MEEFENPKNKKQKRVFKKVCCELCGSPLNKKEEKLGICWECLREERNNA